MHNCENCHGIKETKMETIPYIVHEAEMAKQERREKRMLIAVIASTVSMLLSNLAWLIAFVA